MCITPGNSRRQKSMEGVGGGIDGWNQSFVMTTWPDLIASTFGWSLSIKLATASTAEIIDSVRSDTRLSSISLLLFSLRCRPRMCVLQSATDVDSFLASRPTWFISASVAASVSMLSISVSRCSSWLSSLKNLDSCIRISKHVGNSLG